MKYGEQDRAGVDATLTFDLEGHFQGYKVYFTGGPPHHINTPRGSSVSLVAQLVHSVLSFLLYMASLFIQIF